MEQQPPHDDANAHDASPPVDGSKSTDASLATLCKEVPIPYVDNHSASIRTTLTMVKVGLSTYGVFLNGVTMFLTTQMQNETSVIRDITKRGIKALFHCYRWINYLMQKHPMDWDATRQQCTSITSNIRETLCALTRDVKEEYIQALVREKDAGTV